MISNLITIIFTGLVVYLISGLTLPWILSKKLSMPDGGWGFGKIAGWLAISTPIWMLAHLGLAINTRSGIWLLIILLAAAATIQLQKNKSVIKKQLTKSKPYIIVEEILFWFGFIFLSIVRGYNPDINGLEKFMDHGFMEAYMRSPTLPITDMWLAGFSVNYYTFGHFMGSVFTRIWGVLPEVSYNLLLALILGLTLTHSFQFITTLLARTSKPSLRTSLFAGGVGSLLVGFAGNTQAAWYFITNHSWKGYWYPDATRFITHTIHEFPAYSFIVSDLHGHVWNLAQVIPLMTLILLWFDQLWIHRNESDLGKLFVKLGPWAALIGGWLGLIASTSTWGTMIYGMFLSIAGGMIFVTQRKLKIQGLIVSALVVGISTLITAAPWFFNFEPISEGIRWVTERSDLKSLAILWTGHVTISLIAVITAFKLLFRYEKKNKSQIKNRASFILIFAMFALAILLLILPEFIYFKDIYPTHPRANTMFKLTFQAFIIMLLLAGWLIGAISSLKSSIWKKFATLVATLFVAATLVYPYFGYRDFYAGLREYKGLNGLSWLKKQHPDDYAALKWLKKNTTGRPVVLEGVGESYTTFARVSTYTGLPTVLGWRVHEWLWRGSFDIPGQRSTEVENMYLKPTSYEAGVKFNEYNVEYIFVGDKEREAYPALNESAIKQLGPVVFEQGQTFIVKKNRTRS